MSTEHNPIAVLVSKIQRAWNETVHPFNDYKLVRFIIRSEQARLYEGFLKLESSRHGSIPEAFVVLLTPFKNKESFSKNLIAHWLEQYKADKKKAEEGDSTNDVFSWDFSVIENQLQNENTSYDELLFEMLHSFQHSLGTNAKLVLALMPTTVASIDSFRNWLHDRLTQGIPEQVRLSIFDYEDQRYLDNLFGRFKESTKSLAVAIDLQGAIGKLAKMGDPNSAEVQFRTCIQEMGEATAANDNTRLEKWGTKALEIGQRSGNKSFFASAHIIYAGMLFNFKKYEEINHLLEKGLKLATVGLQEGDESCKVLVIQFHAYQGACKQHEGKELEAANSFVKQGELAIQYGFGVQALTAWWQAYTIYRKKEEKLYSTLLEQTYVHGLTLPIEELQYSCMGYIAFDYDAYQRNLKQVEKCKEIDAFMINVDGENWKEQAEKFKNDTKHKKRFLLI